MLSKFQRNAILMGYIDSYCLVCESHLRTEDDINVHIAKPIHSKNLDANAYVEKFKEDCVRKVKKGYFCEFCNILLATAAKAGLHIAEEKHINNKNVQGLKRTGNNITFHDILINEKAWNGLIDETCAICNTEFVNEHIHKTDTAHILNLVQNKVEFGADKSIYRMIDESSFQCLTCNMVLGLNTISAHFDQEMHKKLFKDCLQAYTDKKDDHVESQEHSRISTPTVAVIKEKSPVNSPIQEKIHVTEAKQTDMFDIFAKKPAIQKEDNITNKEFSTPVSSAKKEVPIAKKPEVTKTDCTVTKKLNKLTLASEDLDEQICKALNAKDYIANDGNGKQWCLLCDWTMDSVIIQNHVNGRHHQIMLKLHKQRLQKTKKIETFTKVEEAKVEKPIPDENKEKILDSVITFQSNDININFESNTAVCKKCKKHLDFNHKSIEAHIDEHKKLPPKKEVVKPAPISAPTQKVEEIKKPVAQQKESKKAQAKHNEEERNESRASSVASNKENDEEIEKFAKLNDLIYNRGNNKVYCRVCDSRIPSSLKNMKEHVAGSHHKNRAAKWYEHKNIKPATVKISMREFIKNISAIENGLMKDVIINERYCINILSFFMITWVGQLRCEPCEVNLTFEQLDDHKCSPSHMRAMEETVVVASLDSEFIREVQADTFHCGFCNEAWEAENLQSHLDSTSHREGKTAAGWRLQQYMPELIQHRQQQRQQLGMLLLLMKLIDGESY